MSKNEKEELKNQEAPQEQLKLDDARRVKVLSPGMLVFKRFIRNKLAVAGIIILAVMFTYSFIGPLFSPYSRAQVFFKEVTEPGDYATGKFNTDSRFVGNASNAIQSAVLKALGSQKSGSKYVLTEGQEIPFTASKEHYTLKVINPDEKEPSCAIYGTKHIATITKGKLSFSDASVDDAMLAFLMADAEANGKSAELDYNGIKISVESSKIERKYFKTADEPIAVSSYNIYTPMLGKIAELQSDTEFLHAVNVAVMAGEESVSYNGKTYTIGGSAEEGYILSGEDGSGLFAITRDYRSGKILIEVEKEDGSTESQEVDYLTVFTNPDGFRAAIVAALAEEATTSFEYEEREFSIDTAASDTEIHIVDGEGNLAMTLANSFEPVESKYDKLNGELGFTFALETAIAQNAAGFEYEGETFALVDNGEDYTINNCRRRGPDGLRYRLRPGLQRHRADRRFHHQASGRYAQQPEELHLHRSVR